MDNQNMRDKLNEAAKKMQEAKEGPLRVPGADNEKKTEPPRPEFRTPSTGPKQVSPGMAKKTPMTETIRLSQRFESKPATKPITTNIIETYTVKKGDTLSGIAKKYYGKGSAPYWKLIQEANKDIIKDANLIYPDQVFKIPELPDELKKK